MSNTVIRVENVSKQYRLGTIGTGTLSSDLKRWFYKVRGKEDPFLKIGEENDRAKKGASEYVWALKDISFDIKKGDVVGVIGKNGAGKSTLLKLLSRTTLPTTGSIKVKGRIASLLEVGTGFHPELTGRENIFLNGAILGMRKAEIRAKFDEIVDFAGVDRYVDTPVKRYSSGMYVRLAFAVAAYLDPEILIVDEVLAVGDAEFQKKALGKMQDVSKGEGRTVLFVSHNMAAISQLCQTGIYLANGRIGKIAPVNEVVSHYLESSFTNEAFIQFPEISDKAGQILTARLIDADNKLCNKIRVGQSPFLEIEYVLRTLVTRFHVAVILTDSIGNHIYSTADTDLEPELLVERKQGTYRVRLQVPTLSLNTGKYNISIGLGIVNGEIFHRVNALTFEIVDVGDFGSGKESGRRKGLLLVQNRWVYL
jgi:lipopolysaccharide transport system ATP-binding protein